MSALNGEGLNAALKAVYENCVSKLNEIEKLDATSWYGIGMDVQKVTKAKAKYGDRAVPRLAEALDVPANDLYSFGRLTDYYAPEEFKRIAGKKNASGRVLTLSHLKVLSEESDKRIREELLNATVTESLTVKDMRAWLQRKRGGRSNNRGPRAESADVSIDKLVKATNDWLARMQNFDDAFFDNLDDLEPEALEEAKEALERLEEFAKNGFEKLTSFEDRVADAD